MKMLLVRDVTVIGVSGRLGEMQMALEVFNLIFYSICSLLIVVSFLDV